MHSGGGHWRRIYIQYQRYRTHRMRTWQVTPFLQSRQITVSKPARGPSKVAKTIIFPTRPPQRLSGGKVTLGKIVMWPTPRKAPLYCTVLYQPCKNLHPRTCSSLKTSVAKWFTMKHFEGPIVSTWRGCGAIRLPSVQPLKCWSISNLFTHTHPYHRTRPVFFILSNFHCISSAEFQEWCIFRLMLQKSPTILNIVCLVVIVDNWDTHN